MQVKHFFTVHIRESYVLHLKTGRYTHREFSFTVEKIQGAIPSIFLHLLCDFANDVIDVSIFNVAQNNPTINFPGAKVLAKSRQEKPRNLL